MDELEELREEQLVEEELDKQQVKGEAADSTANTGIIDFDEIKTEELAEESDKLTK